MTKALDQDRGSRPTNFKQLTRSNLTFPVVGIGASAGGLKALQTLLEHCPADTGMAFVVVMHLSPDHESHVAQILGKSTRMPVHQVRQPTPLEPNHVYVIPPAKHLSMNDGYLRLSDPDPKRSRHVAIDLFFRTLADVHHSHAFGIVMSGAGSDGSVGLARIKEQGGIAFAQSPADAEYESMPRSAIETGKVDFVLPAGEMAQKLLELGKNAQRIELPPIAPPGSEDADEESAEDRYRQDETALRDIIMQLRTRTGHDFRHYKRATVLRRIERRMQVTAQRTLHDYQAYLADTPDESQELLGDLLIGVTNFFRDREAFEALERDVIPRLFSADFQDERDIRVWSAGCSTGEEAFSLAMLLCEQAALEGKPSKLQVFATDIDERAITIARQALYSEAIATDVTPTRLRQYFTKEQSHYRIKKEVREKVLFAQHSLLRDPPFSKLHLISCRNLLIYLDREVQQEILRMFHFALRPGGYLFLGSSESADACSDLFTPIDKKNRLYRATIGAVSRHTPVLATDVYPRSASLSKRSDRNRRKASFAELHQRVLEHYAPPSVIVNHASEIVHMSDRAGHFLRYVGGEPSLELLKLVHPELRLELRTALFQAINTRMSVEARRVRLTRDGRTFYVNMVARPFRDDEHGEEYVLVLFDEVEDTFSEEAKSSEKQGRDSLVLHLEDELQRTKEQLQTTIEQSETSTEELKASNEELQAINEELRSATEELETSKEELQSINEELITVNHELKSKVEETSKINDDLQNLIASTDIATVFVDRGLRIKWYTPRATELFNIIAADAGRSLLDITHRLDYDELGNDATRVFESLGQIEREVRSADGRSFIARLLPYRTVEDRIDGAVLTFIDISARRQAEQALREEEERMRLVAESTCDYAIITMDAEGFITSWNRGAELIFGFTQAEALGKAGDLIFTPEDRESGASNQELARALQQGRAEDERWHRRKDGSRLYCSGVVTPMRNGELRGYVKIARDLTQRKRQEMAQEDELERTHATSLRKDQFFAVMSHELKHPLNLIHLNAELLSRLPAIRGSAVMNKASQSILQAVRSQAQIIDDLLDISRVRTGKLKLNRSAVNLDTVIGEIVKAIQHDLQTSGLKLLYSPLVEDELLLDADVTRVEQIAWNLINNAMKFTPAGGEIQLALRRDGDMARLDVADSGRGLDPDALATVFDLFGQVDASHQMRHKDGLGIGLALVRQLAEAHGGSVEAYSDGIDKGACFSVWLPLLQGTSDVREAAAMSGPERLSGVKILLVDDSLDVLETLQALLEFEGAEVTTANSGQEALVALERSSFDLLLSDIGMPGMDGHQLMAMLRERAGGRPLPAIALTGYGSERDVEQARQSGFRTHLTKPVGFDALIQAVRQTLEPV